jgi:hypothetical protein
VKVEVAVTPEDILKEERAKRVAMNRVNTNMEYQAVTEFESLVPGGTYRVSIRADNGVGEGPFSIWTKVLTLPTENRSKKKKVDAKGG